MVYNEITTQELYFLLRGHEKQVKQIMSAVEKEKERLNSCPDLQAYREQKAKMRERRELLRAARMLRNSVMDELDRRGVLS